MALAPLCPHCSAPLVDAGDIPTFQTEEIGTGRSKSPTFIWAIWCGRCNKLLGILPPTPKRVMLERSPR